MNQGPANHQPKLKFHEIDPPKPCSVPEPNPPKPLPSPDQVAKQRDLLSMKSCGSGPHHQLCGDRGLCGEIGA